MRMFVEKKIKKFLGPVRLRAVGYFIDLLNVNTMYHCFRKNNSG